MLAVVSKPAPSNSRRDVGQLLVGEVACRDEVAEQVVALVSAFGLAQAGHERAQLGEHGHGVLEFEVRAHPLGDDLLEAGQVHIGHSEQFGDDRGRHRQRVAGHHVQDWTVVGHGVEAFGGDLGDPLGQLPHPAHGERADELVPVSGVLRRVHADKHAGLRQAAGRPGRDR